MGELQAPLFKFKGVKIMLLNANLMDGISAAYENFWDVWSEMILYIKNSDYLMVLLVASLLVVAFRIFAYARRAASGDGTGRGDGV